MATQDTKYNVKLSVNVTIEKQAADGTVTTPFSGFNSNMSYNNMDYQQIVATQQVIMNLGQQLVDMGWTGAEAIGFADTAAVEEVAKNGRVKKTK